MANLAPQIQLIEPLCNEFCEVQSLLGKYGNSVTLNRTDEKIILSELAPVLAKFRQSGMRHAVVVETTDPNGFVCFVESSVQAIKAVGLCWILYGMNIEIPLIISSTSGGVSRIIDL